MRGLGSSSNISRLGKTAEGGLSEATAGSVTAKPLLYESVPVPLQFEPNTGDARSN
jgi:hypothetical protein